MKETGIIMSGSHPVDILEGRKTMTRRTWGLEEINKYPDLWEWFGHDNSGRWSFRFKPGDRILNIKCPYGGPGDRLWVRETWSTVIPNGLVFKAGSTGMALSLVKWRSSMFMPRWASRILLEITEVRAERVQDISEEDAISEGCKADNLTAALNNIEYLSARNRFMLLWDSLNAKRGHGWEKNDWVWVINFAVIEEVTKCS